MEKNKYIKFLKRVVSIICIVAIILGMGKGLRYVLIDDSSSYSRIMMHELYEQKNIDIMFCGASLSYRGMIPQIVDKYTGLNTFNTGTSSQNIKTTYFLIKEASNNVKISNIFLELSPVMATYKPNDDDKETAALIVADYMKPSINKYEFLYSSLRPESYIKGAIFPARRNWRNIFNVEYMLNIMRKKKSSGYTLYSYDNVTFDNERYVGKGGVVGGNTIIDGSFNDQYEYNQLKVEDVHKYWYEYLYKIIELCQKKNIKLTLIITPLSNKSICANSEGLQSYHDMIQSIANKKNLKFYDFNLLKADYWKPNSQFYYDSVHLNEQGANVFSRIIADIFSGKLKFEDITLKSYEERKKYIQYGFIGLARNENKYRIVSKDMRDFSYEVKIENSESHLDSNVRLSGDGNFEIANNIVGNIKVIESNKKDGSKKVYNFAIQ